MDKEILNSLVAIATAIIGVAIISVIVGSSNTSNIIKTAGSAFSGVLQAAVSPAAGGGGGTFNPGGGVSSLANSL